MRPMCQAIARRALLQKPPAPKNQSFLKDLSTTGLGSRIPFATMKFHAIFSKASYDWKCEPKSWAERHLRCRNVFQVDTRFQFRKSDMKYYTCHRALYTSTGNQTDVRRMKSQRICNMSCYQAGLYEPSHSGGRTEALKTER